MNINSYMPVKIFSGDRALLSHTEALKKYVRRCLIVTGGTAAANSGALDDVKEAFSHLTVEYAIFDKVEPNPSTKTCLAAGNAAADFGAGFILGIGGGSPLDAAKAAAIYAKNRHFAHDDIFKREEDCPRLPVVLIGTTAGTGSEVTGVSVLTNSNSGYKKSISGGDCYAEIAFCDARYTMSMPYGVTVSTALDALAHAVESFLSQSSNEISEVYAKKAIPIIWNALKYFNNTKSLPDETMRRELYGASIFAGLALNITGTLFPHTLGYILSEDFDIPHGRACTAFMPALIERAKIHMPERLDGLFRLCGAEPQEYDNIIRTLTDVKISFSEDEISRYCSRWDDALKNFMRSPGIFTAKDAVETLAGIKN